MKIREVFSVENRRGYTCGLWTLMHFCLAQSGDSAAHNMAVALSDVIIHHFSCLDCRENFKKEIQDFPLEDITDTNSGIIWLWSLHNSGSQISIKMKKNFLENRWFPFKK